MGKFQEDIESSVTYYDSPRSEPSANDSTRYTILDLEIDRGCTKNFLPKTRQSFCDHHDPDIPLHSYNELPLFLQGNPYVTQGYRVFLSSGLCLRSLFVWSNETVNIWSHLVGFILFTVLLVHDTVILLPSLDVPFSNYFVFIFMIICYQYCMLCSAGYHLFSCHSESAARRWLAVDLSGISIGLIGCYMPALFYAFSCHGVWRDLYMMITCVLSVTVLGLQFSREYFSPKWAKKRTILYLALALFGIIPTAHWSISLIHWGGINDELMTFLPKVIVMYCFGAVALTIYLTKCPERCFPGQFNYIGSSHQLWHIIVVIAFWYWHSACVDLVQFRQQELRVSGECH